VPASRAFAYQGGCQVLHREPEYRRRLRQKAEEDKRGADRERDEATQDARIEKIIGSVEHIVQQIDRYGDEKSPENKRKRRWDIAEVVGLWAAAFVGAAAIVIGSSDSHEQRDIMNGQMDVMLADQRPWLGVGFVGYPPDQPYQLQFINGGKSPAFDVAISAQVWPGDEAAPPRLPTSRCTLDCKVDNLEMLPGVPFQMILLRQFGATGPNGPTFLDAAGWIVGRADYKDAQGRPHKTGVCLYHLPATHDVRTCPIANSNYAD
jgi:hypothetical protein